MKIAQSLFFVAIAFIASAAATPVLEAQDISEMNDASSYAELVIDQLSTADAFKEDSVPGLAIGGHQRVRPGLISCDIAIDVAIVLAHVIA